MQKVYRQNADIVARKVAGEMILVPITGDIANMQHIYSLDPVAEFIWSKLDGKRAIEEIVTLIADEFDVERSQAKEDCVDFIISLHDQGLIEEVC